MHLRLFLSLCFFIVVSQAIAQILPKEGSMLNFRLIGFSFPGTDNTAEYSIEIANGNYDSDGQFKKKIIKTLFCKENKLIAEVPLWGEQYTWRTVAKGNNSRKIKSEFHHFSTILNPDMDTSNMRLRVTEPARQIQSGYIWLDQNKAMYDLEGRPLWFLPGKVFSKKGIKDFKLSPQATITMIAGEEIYEVNYLGDILWKGPNTGIISGDSIEHYHHEFTRLANGHYMVLGNEKPVLMAVYQDSSSLNANTNKMMVDSKAGLPQSVMPTLIEYDEKGNIVWSWKCADYLKQSDLYYDPPGIFAKETIDIHANSFDFDEVNQMIYISFKNISRVLKLKYPEATVVNAYGEIYKPNSPVGDNALFCQQHCVKHSDKGYLYLFNNNACHPQDMPSLVLMEEPGPGVNELKKMWEYKCTADSSYQHVPIATGGDVIELEGDAFFVCTGIPNSKLFIVNRDRNILWSATPEKWDPVKKKWYTIPQYRASITTDYEKIKKLIWNSEN